ncbi:hypothetical protein [Sphaerisporangium sp. NPDC051011]|uniref:hypothetical protein n=1 Tax=Sphaerisporangium sp. NPDC051011 TaxID=3155792 RepID=UPI0033D90648
MRFQIPDCPLPDSALLSLARQDRYVGYLPPELAGAADRPALATMFPQMRSYAFLPGNAFENDADHWGWFDYEASIDAPRLGTSELELVTALREDGRRLLTLNEYAVASQDLHDSTGRYLDERATWARLGSRLDGRMVAARFDGKEMAIGLGDEEPVEGSLLVAYDLAPDDRPRVLGARTSTLGREPARGPATVVRHAGRTLDGGEPRSSGPSARDAFQAAWRDTTNTFLSYGFHHELGLSADRYLATLPKFPQQPEAYIGRMDVPVLVETRIPWRRQAALAGVRLSNGMRTSKVVRLPSRHANERQPYVAWCTDWGRRFPGPIAPAAARDQLAADEVGATVAELLAMELARPDLSRSGKFFEAIGSVMNGLVDAVPVVSAEITRFPCLFHWRGRPELGSNLNPDAYSIFRPLVRGTITTR